MLGIVYTEFMDMVKDRFSEEVLDDLLDAPGLSTEGAFTSVGYYTHTDMIKLVVTLSQVTDIPVDTLVEVFGEHLFGVLISKYPTLAEGKSNALDMLESVDGTIHIEVMKLYPNAELPSFTCQRLGENHLLMQYRSKRPFSLLALGLIKGCAKYYGETLEISHESFDTESMFETHFDIRNLS